MEDKILISKEKLQQLLSYYHSVSGLCEDLDIYEHDMLDSHLQEANNWVNDNFGYKIDKNEY